MSLQFASGADNYVNVGSAASLDNLTAITILAWVYPTSIATNDQVIWSKTEVSSFTAYNTLYLSSGGGGDGSIYADTKRATTDTLVNSAGSVVSDNAWQFIGAVKDTGGASSDQKLYYGTLSAVVAEVGSYTTQQVGSGTVGDDSAQSASIGNASPTSPQSWSRFIGSIAWVGVWNRKLSLSEIQVQSQHPQVTSGCVGMWFLGLQGTSTHIDFSGNSNSGTVTGATVSDNPPIWLFSSTASNSQIFLPQGVSVTVSPTEQTATFSIASPSLSTSQILSQNVQSVTLSIPSVTISTSQILDAGVQDLTLSIPASTVNISYANTPGTQTVTLSTNAVDFILDQILAVSAQTATFSIPVVTVSLGGDISVTPADAQLLTLLSNSPEIVTSAILSVPTQTIILTLNSPVVSTFLPSTAKISRTYIILGLR